MAGAIIWSIIVFGCAFLFLGIGIYASKREKPMWFYSGTTVDASKISDVKAYNRECGRSTHFGTLFRVRYIFGRRG